MLFRWDAPLFFANAELFNERVLDAVAASPTPVRWLVVAAEPVTSVDVTSADMLAELDETLHAAGIKLCVAEMKDPVKDKLKRFGLFARLGETAFFPTIDDAVDNYLVIHPVEGAGRAEWHWIYSATVFLNVIQIDWIARLDAEFIANILKHRVIFIVPTHDETGIGGHAMLDRSLCHVTGKVESSVAVHIEFFNEVFT